MTETAKKERPSGWRRDTDGMLVWVGGIGTRYDMPSEAIKTYHAGKARPGCNYGAFHTYHHYPCGKTPKHDPDAQGRPTKCGLHSKAAFELRNAKKDATTARWKRQWSADAAAHEANHAIEVALRQIAAGHNDPRGLAQEKIEALDAAKAESAAAHRKG